MKQQTRTCFCLLCRLWCKNVMRHLQSWMRLTGDEKQFAQDSLKTWMSHISLKRKCLSTSAQVCSFLKPPEKLWVWTCLSRFIIHKHKGTIHKPQTVIMALEDTKLFYKNIYALTVDFTSAFNSTNRDRMLWIMYDLGFPTDVILQKSL